MSDSLRRDWNDIRFAAVAEPEDYHCEFKVYEIAGSDEDSVVLVGHVNSSPVDTESLDEATVYLHGYVKWDGCSNWYFDEQDRVMLHFCEKEQAQAIGVLLGRLYDWAKELIPNWWE